MASTSMSDSELGQLEEEILSALATRSSVHLNVLGFGETGVALSWPSTDPTLVVKRVTSEADLSDANAIKRDLQAYIAGLEQFVTVADTDVRLVSNKQGRTAIYIVQPLFENKLLVETILKNTEPSQNHPIIEALSSLIMCCTEDGTTAVDAQFSNFAWVDEQLVLFDVGTPLMFDADGKYALETKYIRRVMPAPFRGLAERKYTEVISEIGSRRGSFQQAVMSLVRQDQERWVEPALATFNPDLDPPLSLADVNDRAKQMHKDSSGLKRLMQLERAWSQKVRRRPYDVFITDSFTGELL